MSWHVSAAVSSAVHPKPAGREWAGARRRHPRDRAHQPARGLQCATRLVHALRGLPPGGAAADGAPRRGGWTAAGFQRRPGGPVHSHGRRRARQGRGRGDGRGARRDQAGVLRPAVRHGRQDARDEARLRRQHSRDAAAAAAHAVPSGVPLPQRPSRSAVCMRCVRGCRRAHGFRADSAYWQSKRWRGSLAAV